MRNLLVVHVDLALDLVGSARCFRRLGFDRLLFLVGVNWAFQGYDTVLRDHFDVVRVGRQRFVLDDGSPHLLSQRPVRRVFFLLGGSRFVRIPVTLVHLGVVRSGSAARLCRVLSCCYAETTENQSRRQKRMTCIPHCKSYHYEISPVSSPRPSNHHVRLVTARSGEELEQQTAPSRAGASSICRQ